MPKKLQAQVSTTLYERVKRQASADGHKIGEFVRIAVSRYLHEREMAKK